MNNRNPAIPLSKNEHLLRWVEKMTELCKPDSLHWVDGSKEEYDSLCKAMVDNGTFIELNQKLWPGCFYARSNPGDVARVEDRTFICSNSRDGAGPTNNWVNPFDMRRKLRELFNGAMRGRTMYVLPFSMGPVGSPMAKRGHLVSPPWLTASRSSFAVLQSSLFPRLRRCRQPAIRFPWSFRSRTVPLDATSSSPLPQSNRPHLLPAFP